MSVLVTGGLGYIGCHVVRELLGRGDPVVALDLMLYQEQSPVQHPALRAVRGDVRDGALVRELVRGRSAVIHLAGISLDGAAVDPALARSMNVDALDLLLRESVRAGVERFVYASSCSVYGSTAGGEIDEDTPAEPSGAYAEAKLAGEEIVRGYASRIQTTVLRAATVCGASPRQRLDLFVNGMVAQAVVRGQVSVAGENRIRPSVHVMDLARAYGAIVHSPAERVAGRRFNIAYENRTVLETAELVAGMTGAELARGEAASSDARSYHVSSQRIEEELGFRPERGVRDAIEELAKCLRNGSFQEPLTNPMYHNRQMEALKLSRLEPALAV